MVKIKTLAKIPKLGVQQKVIHDFKPTEYLQPSKCSLSVGVQKPLARLTAFIPFTSSNICLVHGSIRDETQAQYQPCVISTQLPKVEEWTRMEISHKEVDGNIPHICRNHHNRWLCKKFS